MKSLSQIVEEGDRKCECWEAGTCKPCRDNIKEVKTVYLYKDGKVDDYIKSTIISSHLTLLQSELERKKGMMKEERTFTYDEPNLGVDIGSYNVAIKEDIVYLEGEIQKIKKV